MPLTMLLGGARSGKSSLAVEIGHGHDGPVVFIATAPALDDDMERRIRLHQAERPAEWATVEEQIDLHTALLGADDESLVIVDCLTLWVSNLMYAGRSDAQISESAAAISAVARDRTGPVVAVSNEVGMGVHPDTALGRRYRDLLGRVNQTLCAASSASLLLVAGKAIELTDPWQYLDGFNRPDPNRD